jgi:hypothetical protein
MTTPLTELDVINADMAITKAKLKLAEEQNNDSMILTWANILLEQQRKKNFTMAAQSKKAIFSLFSHL